MSDQAKRILREHKRVVKRVGNRLRRRELKKLLEQSPDDAATHSVSVGYHQSSELNGIDQDLTRRKESE